MAIRCYISFIGFLIIYGSIAELPDPYTIIGEQTGDLSLGGLMAMHDTYDIYSEKCKNYYLLNILRAQAIVYAVDTINQDATVLPNITLGYEIRDTCLSRMVALRQSINYFYADRNEKQRSCDTLTTKAPELFNSSNTNCSNGFCRNSTDDNVEMANTSNSNNNYNQRGRVISVVGPIYSSEAFTVATLLSNLRIPLISPFATSSVLNDKTDFSTFFRTVPPNNIQGRAIADLIKHFRWNYTAVLWEDDDDGGSLLTEFKHSVLKENLCLSAELLIPKRPTAIQLQTIIKRLRTLNVTVVLLASNVKIAQEYFTQAKLAKFVGITYIAPISWSESASILSNFDSDVIGGAIGLSLYSYPQNQFISYLKNLTVCDSSINPWLQDYMRSKMAQNGTSSNLCLPISTLDDVNVILNANSIKSEYIFNAVRAIAYALHDMLKCNNDYCPPLPDDKLNVKELVAYISNISFTGASGETFKFNSYFNPAYAHYDITNLQPVGKRVVLKIVGRWRTIGSMVLHDNQIVWNKFRSSSGIPISVCSSDCLPGTYRQQESKCCWKCKPCSENRISNTTNAIQCHSCPLKYSPNSNRSLCIELIPIPIEMGGMLSIALMTTLAICSSIILTFWVITIIHRHHQVIFSSNPILIHTTYIALLYILASSFIFLLPQTPTYCVVTIVMFTTSVTWLSSIALSMTGVIVALFTEVLSTCHYSEQIKKKGQPIFVFLLLCIQIAILAIWLLINPVTTEIAVDLNRNAYRLCNFQSYAGAITSISYIVILMLIACGFAIKNRHNPDNFSEAKYLCVACCISVCIFVFIVLIYSITFGPLQAGLTSFSLVGYAMSYLFCVIAPKISIILSFPQLVITVK